MSFILSGAAEEDIIGIAEHGVANFGIAQARRYHDELFDTLELLTQNPRMARERDEITPPVRIHPFKAHLIIYRVEDNDMVFVIRIRHAHEDWSNADH